MMTKGRVAVGKIESWSHEFWMNSRAAPENLLPKST
jgi:hypothetical protein